MNYCDNCGTKINEGSNFCTNCGKMLNQTNRTQTNTGIIITCAIVGFLFPLIGTILYYALKSTDMKAAKVANRCSWIGFLIQVLCYIFIRSSIFVFIGL